jgi:phosphocarrier protein HPr|tara:strand:- start:571 stop:855 length:285 start_codon:yes stop_codon:yes gene_type:complete
VQVSDQSLKFELEVSNQLGVHARPAAMIVRIANKYEGEVWLEKDGERVNGKSIMGIMMLAAAKGTKLTIHADCKDTESLKEEMTTLFRNNFQDE